MFEIFARYVVQPGNKRISTSLNNYLVVLLLAVLIMDAFLGYILIEESRTNVFNILLFLLGCIDAIKRNKFRQRRRDIDNTPPSEWQE